ncbi:DUF2188 domain-containing protein [Agrobacterium larrymoorei]|uniref:DUF2188 domain-containing protein n=1 Tax=Agrobacterium larrymoorei TaxID=160699 RepID=A0A4D7DZL4_9HYPH|nr:DUF2188 domain-containing protein [Agrobacterium larrymoorei]QCI97330.1 DUF2188 domain-containing protein [Agrobacterium larrymoorei]QYA07236.1 DUF2188 domain-containing protein [Agrobacterium larrymoorei]
MTKICYEIVEHDGGWAYRMDGAYSEAFPSHSDALQAAKIAAAEQQVGGEDEEISYQDERGRWHEEHSQGGDRPEAEVVDRCAAAEQAANPA